MYFLLFVNDENGTVGSVYPFCSKEPIHSASDKIYIVPLPNINESGNAHFCLGSNAYEMGWPLYKKVDFVVSGIFSTTWNDDLQMRPMKDFGFSSFREWSDNSMKNPLFWNELKMVEHKHKTVQGLIDLWLKH
jgi:hypothetical protein